LFYNDSVSQEFKLDLKPKRFTVSCLSQSFDIIITTAMCLHLSLAVLALITRCHLLEFSIFFKNYPTLARNQQFIHSCWICYVATCNNQQPYISMSVSCDTKEHQY